MREWGCTNIIHDGPILLVPEKRDGVSALVFTVGLKVDLVQVPAIEEVVGRGAWILIIVLRELPPWPSFLVTFRIRFDDRDWDNRGKALEVPD